ncbi:MAG: response regulator [Caldisericia bacterium]|jgi:DNA-binding response OmpR family regulator|nr:response regulator [Caldisericia bacterium]HOJ16403.1 response regulator [Caldisericia bacterium]HOW02920.1 response regulator [Caldisericia bacterium]HPO29062.1 response regulator [Caldisericia bacterium]HXK70256.1 response regulator [Caldisericia bacterium]
MKKNILLIEDDKDISELISYNLKKENFNVITAYDGEEALNLIKDNVIDLIILDLMLPSVSGIDLLKYIKRDEKTKNIPVIIETAKGEENDIVLGLELGADDYVTKPFSPKVLVARIKRLIERTEEKSINEKLLNAGPVTLDLTRHKVTLKGKPIELTLVEFKLLNYLISNKGKALSRDEILANIWLDEVYVIDRVVDVHINSIRKKLGEESYLIETVRGIGYTFKER